MTTNHTIKAQQPTTGAVHYGFKRIVAGREHILPSCGGSRTIRYSLSPVADDAPVTCKRCAAKAPAAAPETTTWPVGLDDFETDALRKAYRANLAVRDAYKARAEAVAVALGSGLSLRQIAAATGLSKSAVAKIAAGLEA